MSGKRWIVRDQGDRPAASVEVTSGVVLFFSYGPDRIEPEAHPTFLSAREAERVGLALLVGALKARSPEGQRP